MNNLSGKYFVKRGNAAYADVTTKWDGMKILSIDGFNEHGDAVNVYNVQWVEAQAEDFLVTKKVSDNDVIIRSNVDLTVTFIIGRRYASTPSGFSEQTTYDNVVSYLNGGDFYIKSAYTNKEAHVICLKSFKPTTQKLQRGNKSYILATVTLHTLDVPTTPSS